jgi:uncharacterized Zn finger protein (UPF0148 family)
MSSKGKYDKPTAAKNLQTKEETKMTRQRKITVKNRLNAVIESIPEEERTARVQAAMKGLGGSLHVTEFETCPACGCHLFEVAFSHGSRTCRSCGHYEKQRYSAEENAEVLAHSRARWASNHRAVA